MRLRDGFGRTNTRARSRSGPGHTRRARQGIKHVGDGKSTVDAKGKDSLVAEQGL
jgi:hypothetical protein